MNAFDAVSVAAFFFRLIHKHLSSLTPHHSLPIITCTGTSHTVWGRVADEQSMQVVENIVKLPATAPPGGMHMLDERVPYNVRSDSGQAVGI